jgi:hypothetical protein
MTREEEESAGLPVFTRFRLAQRALEDGTLRIGTPEYERISADARYYSYGLRIPAWQLPRRDITSNGYRTDLESCLRWMGLRPAERKALLDRYAPREGAKTVTITRIPGCEGRRVGKPTLRYSYADTQAILDAAYEVCIARARERGLLE